jgi:hypothetical protein
MCGRKYLIRSSLNRHKSTELVVRNRRNKTCSKPCASRYIKLKGYFKKLFYFPLYKKLKRLKEQKPSKEKQKCH